MDLQSQSEWRPSKMRIIRTFEDFLNILRDDVHRLELALKFRSRVEPCETIDDSPEESPASTFSPLALIKKPSVGNETFDVVGKVERVDVARVRRADGSTPLIKTLFISDQSGVSRKVTLWEQKAESFTADVNSVVVIRRLKSKEYRGEIELYSCMFTHIEVNPSSPEVEELRRLLIDRDNAARNLFETQSSQLQTQSSERCKRAHSEEELATKRQKVRCEGKDKQREVPIMIVGQNEVKKLALARNMDTPIDGVETPNRNEVNTRTVSVEDLTGEVSESRGEAANFDERVALTKEPVNKDTHVQTGNIQMETYSCQSNPSSAEAIKDISTLNEENEVTKQLTQDAEIKALNTGTPIQPCIPHKDSSQSGQTIEKTKLEDRQICQISKAIGKNWQQLGYSLGFTFVEIERIEMDIPGSSQLQILKMLQTWKSRAGTSATMEALHEKMLGTPDVSIDFDVITNLIETAQRQRAPDEKYNLIWSPGIVKPSLLIGVFFRAPDE